MLSTKNQQTRLAIKNPFSNSFSSYGQRSSQLQINARQLKQRFPFEDLSKIKSLLEELDNSVPMVTQILEQESPREMPIKRENDSPKLSPIEENRILKSAFLRCYKKLIRKEKETTEMEEMYERVKRENYQLRMNNQLLMSKDYSSNELDRNSHIY